MGSSLHALHPLQLHLVRAGHTAIMVETGELIHTQANLLDDRTMVVVVSQSGRSVETLQLLDLLSDEVFVLVFSGDPATAAMNEALVRDVRAAGGRAALVGALVERGAFRLPEVPARLRPVVEMLPVQMVSLALGALAGREAGRFERASKITTIA